MKSNKENKADSWEFYSMLDRVMKDQNVSGDKLSEGLCSSSMLSRIRKGERTSNKMMRDRLMSRLGMSCERFENFLFYEDYKDWEERSDIIESIENKEIEELEDRLNRYIDFNRSIQCNIGIQFGYIMQFDLMICQKASTKDLAKKTDEALKLTVPNIEQKKIENLQLSLEELNLILEYEKYNHPENLVNRCEEILLYVNNSRMDNQSKAKIYPKVALKKFINYVNSISLYNIIIILIKQNYNGQSCQNSRRTN